MAGPESFFGEFGSEFNIGVTIDFDLNFFGAALVSRFPEGTVRNAAAYAIRHKKITPGIKLPAPGVCYAFLIFDPAYGAESYSRFRSTKDHREALRKFWKP